MSTPVAVNGTLVDSFGATWAAATVSFSLIRSPGQPGPYLYNGSPVVIPTPVTASTSGVFTVNLPKNTDITPLGTLWRLTIAGNTDSPAVILRLNITQATNISTLFTNSAVFPTIRSLALPRSYNGNQVASPADDGQMYYNSGVGQVQISKGGAWGPFSNATGGGIASTNAILQGNGSGGAIASQMTMSGTTVSFTWSGGLPQFGKTSDGTAYLLLYGTNFSTSAISAVWASVPSNGRLYIGSNYGITLSDGSGYNIYLKMDYIATNSTALFTFFSPVIFDAPVTISSLAVYANNAAAIAGGLTVGQIYRTGADPDVVCIVH